MRLSLTGLAAWGWAETHGEAVIDVLGAGLGHTGVGQVDLVKDDGLQRHTQDAQATSGAAGVR